MSHIDGAIFTDLLDSYDFSEVVQRRKPKHSGYHCSSSPSLPAQGSGTSSISSTTSDESARSKRVSFASEVSFHSPQQSPHCLPKKLGEKARKGVEVEAVEMGGDVLTLHLVDGKRRG